MPRCLLAFPRRMSKLDLDQTLDDLSSVLAPNLCFRALGCPGCLLVVLRRMPKLDLDQKLDDLFSV